MRRKKMGEVRKTTFSITESAAKFEELLLVNMDIPRTIFHRRMIDYFLENEGEIYPQLLAKRGSEQYVNKPVKEQIYLDAEREKKLLRVQEKYNCKIGTVLFQALLDYSIAIAPEVLEEEAFTKIV